MVGFQDFRGVNALLEMHKRRFAKTGRYHLVIAVTRLLVTLTFLALLATPAAAQAAPASEVSMTVSGGYDGYYRESAWVPIRVSLRNVSPTTISGSLSAQGAADTPRASIYTEPVVLAPGVRKLVTIEVPGADVQGRVDIAYRQAGAVVASSSVYPNPYGDTDFVVGTLSDDPAAVGWIPSIAPWRARLRVVTLSRDALAPSPGVLATFDALVLSNVDTSRFTGEQVTALEQYVWNGGTLIAVGGPAWEETLAPLPGALLPARPSGTALVRNLDGLSSLGDGTPPSHIVTITRFDHVHGAARAAQRGIPLLVESELGDGLIELLAFDPSVAPVAGWRQSRRLLTTLVAGAAPLAMRRAGLAPVDRASSFLNPGTGALDLGSELVNLSQPPLSTVLAFPLILVAESLLVLVCLALVIVRWRRSRAAWLALVGLAVLCVSGERLASPVARSQAFVNTLNVVFMGQGEVHPADRYVALLAPVAGDYSLTYPAPAEAQDAPPPRDFNPAGAAPDPSMFGEGPATEITFPGVQTWTSRAVALRTTMTVGGSIVARLRLDSSGAIVGSVSNHMGVALQRPAVIAGRAYVRLPDLPAGAMTSVHLIPRVDVQDNDYEPMLTRIYGQALPDYAAMLEHRLPVLPGVPPGMPPERTLEQRIRNAASALPETQILPALSEVMLVAWSDRSLDPVGVAGGAATHRDLTLLVQPLSVGLAHGRFRLPTGVLAARALEVVPKPPQYPCCGPTIQPVSLGNGGQAMFAFQLPPARYSSLSVDLYAGGADRTASGYSGMPSGAAQVYDWRASRWVALRFAAGTSRLTHPIRFISYTGTLLLRLVSTARTGDLTILDPGHDIQLHGGGVT